jgi:alkaline phosphatase
MNRPTLRTAAPRILATTLAIILTALSTSACKSTTSTPPTTTATANQPASVIFLHPDGAGANAWAAARMLHVGPDADLHWDKLPVIGLYRGHLRDALTATSNAGGTIHAYGLKVGHESFGNDNGAPLLRDAQPAKSIARQALDSGRALGIVSTATVADAGTGTFLASAKSRKLYTQIAAQMLDARPHVLLGGGESLFLPAGVMGRHGPGKRDDSRNLIDEARAAGYSVVFTRDELLALPKGTTRLLGLFAHDDTFLDKPEEQQRTDATPDTVPGSPTYAQMVQAALNVLSTYQQGFLLVAEEEGTDNFPGKNNARATLDALKRADDAIAVAKHHLAKSPRTFLMVASDSDCGGMQVWGEPDLDPAKPLPPADENGAPIDGRQGTATPPFVAAPDRAGRRLPFGIVWASEGDLAGAVLVRGDGYRARELITPSMDNTQIYAAIRAALFGTPRSP